MKIVIDKSGDNSSCQFKKENKILYWGDSMSIEEKTWAVNVMYEWAIFFNHFLQQELENNENESR